MDDKQKAAAVRMYRALSLVAVDEAISRFLALNDAKALEQVNAARVEAVDSGLIDFDIDEHRADPIRPTCEGYGPAPDDERAPQGAVIANDVLLGIIKPELLREAKAVAPNSAGAAAPKPHMRRGTVEQNVKAYKTRRGMR